MGWGFSLRIFIRLFRNRFKLGKLAKHPWNSECLAFSESQVFRCMFWRTRGVSVLAPNEAHHSANPLWVVSMTLPPFNKLLTADNVACSPVITNNAAHIT
ncbi:hypothetical protein PIB30_049949 [Stylosanthes scabra]|uniref:Uncharacterized protein n=1 Tax=Stylosanthes scabra TaxID=79078 RepID=A0ABU6UGD3_9FABA|nr:hypothetical protein [Stylosanthes scabra]